MQDQSDGNGESDWKSSAKAAILGVVSYFLLAAEAIHLTSDGRNVASVWPADAAILALLLNSPRREWPTILLAGWGGNLIANIVTRGWMPGLILYGAINMAQTLLAAVLIMRAEPHGRVLENTRSAAYFLICAGALAPIAGATAGGLALLYNYGQPFGESFLRWFISNGLGFLVFTPFLSAIFNGSYAHCLRGSSNWRRVETLILVSVHLAVTMTTFSISRLPLQFLPFASLLLLSFRVGRLGAMVGVMIVALAGTWSVAAGGNPMGTSHATLMGTILFQLYLGVMLCTTILISATVASRADALRKLAERDQALRQIMNESPDTILGFDEHGKCNWAGGNLQDQLGVSAEKVLGQPVETIARLTCADLTTFVNSAQPAEGEVTTHEFSPAHRPGRTFEASLGILTTNGRRTGAVVTIRDVSKRKSHEQAMSRMAETDDLTGILNRKGFRARIDKALSHRRASPVTLALIDVDHFKNINDNFGHTVGDRVLEHIAAHINQGTREGDVVGRLGGDEFAILFQCDLPTAHAACERIVRSVNRLAVIHAQNVRVTTSLSCGIAPHSPGMSGGELFDAADAALYRAKKSGRNGVHTADLPLTG